MMKPPLQFFKLQKTTKARGFTLVELLVVIFILGALALTATFFVDGLDDQTRFDDTKSRLQQIRVAIIGDASRSLNGQADVSGFVADMGRLPKNLQELIEKGEMDAWGAPISIDVGGVSPVSIELYGGWRGPYLETLPESDGVRRFRDGWGSADSAGLVGNFGWDYNASDVSGVSAISYGKDGIPDDAGGSTEPYAKDYPTVDANLVALDDFIVRLNEGLTIRFNKPADIPAGVLLRLFYVKDNAETEGLEIDDPESNVFDTLSGVQSVQATFPELDNTVSHGRFAAVLICTVVEGGASEEIYDGNCGAPHKSQVYYFTLTPRAQLPTIPWNIQ